MHNEELYFDKKLDEILAIVGNDDTRLEKIKNNLRIKLKEIARDQRMACVDAVLSYDGDVNEASDAIQGLIQNAQINK